MNEVEDVQQLLARCTKDQRREIFSILRKEFAIHPLEAELNTEAEVILEAVRKSELLTGHDKKGLIAQAAFERNVASKIQGFRLVEVKGDAPFNCYMADTTGEVKIQVAMQCVQDHRPMMADQADGILPAGKYVVETQRDPSRRDSAASGAALPYRFGEFNILAVSLQPSTNDWNRFLFTVERWLMPDPVNESHLRNFQPVPTTPDNNWTDDLAVCIEWFRSPQKRTIS